MAILYDVETSVNGEAYSALTGHTGLAEADLLNVNRSLNTAFTAGTNVKVRVKAYDGSASSYSNVIDMTVAVNTAPTVPTNLQSSAITVTGFTLSWTASTDAENNPITYNVYKNGVIYQTGVTGTSLIITGQTSGSSATWTVSAYDGTNESAQSAGLSVTTANMWATTADTNVDPTSTFDVVSGQLVGSTKSKVSGTKAKFYISSTQSFDCNTSAKTFEFELEENSTAGASTEHHKVGFEGLDPSGKSISVFVSCMNGVVYFTSYSNGLADASDVAHWQTNSPNPAGTLVPWKIKVTGGTLEVWRNGTQLTLTNAPRPAGFQPSNVKARTYVSSGSTTTANVKKFDNFKVTDADGTTILLQDDFTVKHF